MEIEKSNNEIPLSFNELNAVISSELGSMKKMDKALESLETFLLSDEILDTLSYRDLCTVYDLALKRKAMSHSFIFKMLDLGVKTSLLNKMFEIEQENTGNILVNDTPKKVVEAKEAIKRLMDQQIKSDVKETLIQDTLITSSIVDVEGASTEDEDVDGAYTCDK